MGGHHERNDLLSFLLPYARQNLDFTVRSNPNAIASSCVRNEDKTRVVIPRDPWSVMVASEF